MAPQISVRKRALSIAINYIGLQRGQLNGCIHDQETMVALWKNGFGVSEGCIKVLRDDDRDAMPTKANMLLALDWLVEGLRFGDKLYFHYSGHGGQTRDFNGDEWARNDETLIPCDYLQSGMISEDDLRRALVLRLPEGVSLFGVLDCCHSGTGMDLPYVATLESDERSVTLSRKPAKYTRGQCLADIVMLSACKDTSADTQINQRYAGAMTQALYECIKKRPTVSFHHLLQSMRRYLKRGKHLQVPQLSSERILDLSEAVIPPR